MKLFKLDWLDFAFQIQENRLMSPDGVYAISASHLGTKLGVCAYMCVRICVCVCVCVRTRVYVCIHMT